MKVHKENYDEACEVCIHENLEEIERCYLMDLSAKAVTNTAQTFKLNRKALAQHIKTLGLEVKKTDQTDKYLALLIDRGKRVLENEQVPVSPELFLKAIRLKAEMKGELIPKNIATGPQLVLQGNFMLPGAIPDSTKDTEVIEGEVTYVKPLIDIKKTENEESNRGD